MHPVILEGIDNARYEERQNNKEKIWHLLVDRAGANPKEYAKSQFMQSFPECKEFRFQGRFGFGGKIWWNNGKVYVNYYPEDQNEMRDKLEKILNAELSQYKF